MLMMSHSGNSLWPIFHFCSLAILGVAYFTSQFFKYRKVLTKISFIKFHFQNKKMIRRLGFGGGVITARIEPKSLV